MIIYSRMTRLFWVIACLSLTFATTNCRKKKSRGGDAATAEQEEKETIIGQETEPITPDKVVTLETEDSGAIRLLTVEATDATEIGRYKSEYLLIVRSQARSCIRLKVRPTEGGVTESVDKSNLDDDGGAAACSVEKDTKLAQSSQRKREVEKTASLTFEGPTNRALRNREFGLVETNLCSTRLFRMPTKDTGDAIESVRNKTGRLAYKRSINVGGVDRWVYVWLDEEVSRISCDANGMVDESKIAFSPLWPRGFKGYYDKLTFDHVKAVGDNAAESYKTLGDVYGDVSDVDENNGIDIFISPDINRLKFEKVATSELNQFRAYLNLRSNDLANYDANTNPAGNEGEIVYLWAPDPFGRFQERIYPSSGSLTTNYARGYMGSQVMNIISTKKKLLDRKKSQEETWLREAFGYLASAYVGGNDYSFYGIANYLSSRPQHISITEKLDDTLFTKEAFAFADDEQQGMRAMFAWYLHSRFCGTSLTPCAELSRFLDTDLNGIENIEAGTELKFSKLLENFGLSVGVELTDRPGVTRSFWDNPEEGMPAKFKDLPLLRKLTNGGETQFVNMLVDASSHTVEAMPRFAGPFVSYDMEIFQPIFPDNDLDITLENNSVTYILLSGLLEKKTDITASLGKFLNVVIIPIGERNSDSVRLAGEKRTRFMHTEKVSENAHLDIAPVNLTTQQASRVAIPGMDPTFSADFEYPSATYFMPIEYPEVVADATTTVTEDRELWLVGNIENQTITVDGAETILGDTDAFNLEVDPCKDSTDSGCAAKQFQVIVQMYARDYTSEINPMFLVTNTDPELFRGASILATVSEWDPEMSDKIIENYEGLNNVVPVFCDGSGNHIGDLGIDQICATNATLKNGSSKFFFDHQDYISEMKFAQNYDNFLFMGPLGYPFYNVGTILKPDNIDERAHLMDFSFEEANRMFYDMNFIRGNEPTNFIFIQAHYDESLSPHRISASYTSNIPYTSPKYHTVMSEGEIGALKTIKTFLDNCCTTLSQNSLDDILGDFDLAVIFEDDIRPILEPYVGLASEISAQDLTDIENIVLASLYTDLNERKFISCIDRGSHTCSADLGNLNSAGTSVSPPNTTSWNVPFISSLDIFPYSRYQTFYRPHHSVEDPIVSGGCNAQTIADPSQMINIPMHCDNDDSGFFTMTDGDIRHQFNVRESEFITEDCAVSSQASLNPCNIANHKVSSDGMSFWRVDNPDEEGAYKDAKQMIEEEVKIDDYYSLQPTTEHSVYHISKSAGEITSKETRFHEQAIRVPGSGSSFFQIIAGGRLKTQGKYLIRVRVKEFSEIKQDQLNVGNY